MVIVTTSFILKIICNVSYSNFDLSDPYHTVQYSTVLSSGLGFSGICKPTSQYLHVVFIVLVMSYKNASDNLQQT